METYELDHTIFTRANAGDDSLFVVFYTGVIKDEEKSVTEGRPIFNDVECVRIVIPGDKNLVNDRPASKADKQRFAKQYALFMQGKSEEEQVSGTRLSEWPLMSSRAQVQELAYLGIKTVEQLSNVRDDIVAKVPGLMQLKQHAAIYLARAEKGAEAAKIAKRMQEQDSEVESLKTSLKEQAALIEKLMKEKSNAR